MEQYFLYGVELFRGVETHELCPKVGVGFVSNKADQRKFIKII